MPRSPRAGGVRAVAARWWATGHRGERGASEEHTGQCAVRDSQIAKSNKKNIAILSNKPFFRARKTVYARAPPPGAAATGSGGGERRADDRVARPVSRGKTACARAAAAGGLRVAGIELYIRRVTRRVRCRAM